MVKIPTDYDRDTSPAKFTDISRQVTPCFATRCVLVFARELWWMNQEWLDLRWGRTIEYKMVAVHVTLCSIPPRNSNQYLTTCSQYPRSSLMQSVYRVSAERRSRRTLLLSTCAAETLAWRNRTESWETNTSAWQAVWRLRHCWHHVISMVGGSGFAVRQKNPV
jgi:hypothetical protein